MLALKTAIGVCAFNEEHNIRRLLEHLAVEPLPDDCRILVVCSGCTDGTTDVVKEFQSRDERIQPIVEETRSGKANALNKIFQEAKKFDVLVLVNADALPEPESIHKLLGALASSDAGVFFAQPVPFESSGLSYRIVKVIWRLHHLISLKSSPKLSGELCAIRTVTLQPIPEEIATDEPYIEHVIRQQGYKIGYLPEAIVRIRCPTNLSDLLKQRKRIWIGHMQLKKSTGFDVSTSNFKNILYALPDLSASEVFFAFLGGIIEAIAYSQARLAKNKAVPYMWEPIKSTKISIST
ncbi:MAG: glycosyltransferase [Candidatus Bathyarchaeia archaeon]|jgi:cellulose synthase/poly-beta-1,6-N-acetylglucosamine synthase-like glycosyltransferase